MTRAEYLIDWRERNRERSRLVAIQWRKDNLLRSRATVKCWKQRNPERRKKINKVWRLRNRDAWNAIRAARRARQKGANGRYTAASIANLIVKQKHRCLCGVSFNKTKHTVDHKTPLSRGGSNWPRNLQLLCMPCNDSKGIKTMREWVR